MYPSLQFVFFPSTGDGALHEHELWVRGALSVRGPIGTVYVLVLEITARERAHVFHVDGVGQALSCIFPHVALVALVLSCSVSTRSKALGSDKRVHVLNALVVCQVESFHLVMIRIGQHQVGIVSFDDPDLESFVTIGFPWRQNKGLARGEMVESSPTTSLDVSEHIGFRRYNYQA